MSNHRFRKQIKDLYWKPRMPEHPTVAGFVVCPLVLIQGESANQSSIQQQVYQWAFQQALATVQPSRLENAFAVSRN
jgi:hypothetical protein